MQQPKKDERRTARAALEKENAYAKMLEDAKAVVLHGEPPKRRGRGNASRSQRPGAKAHLRLVQENSQGR
jgi:hypothetical protein